MSASILATSTYTYPIPQLADGKTLATTSASDTSTIDQIREKYLEVFGGADDPGNAETYYAKLKDALGILKEILDGYAEIDTSSAEKLRGLL